MSLFVWLCAIEFEVSDIRMKREGNSLWVLNVIFSVWGFRDEYVDWTLSVYIGNALVHCILHNVLYYISTK